MFFLITEADIACYRNNASGRCNKDIIFQGSDCAAIQRSIEICISWEVNGFWLIYASCHVNMDHSADSAEMLLLESRLKGDPCRFYKLKGEDFGFPGREELLLPRLMEVPVGKFLSSLHLFYVW